jgi:hypothetical protein
LALKDFLRWQTDKSIDEQIQLLQTDQDATQVENDEHFKNVY